MASNDGVFGEDKQEEDYMNMVIVEPPQNHRVSETYTQKRLRKEREARNRSIVKSKKEQAIEEKRALEQALATPIVMNDDAKIMKTPKPMPNIKNRGLAMMTKMGFKLGSALGRPDNPEAMLEPVVIQMKEDRGGLGLDTDKKRKWTEFVKNEEKRSRTEEQEYRERIRETKDQARLEVLVGKAMRIAELMHEEREKKEKEPSPDHLSLNHKINQCPSMLSQNRKINVLWRGLVRMREEKERLRCGRHRLSQSLSSRLPTYDNSDEDPIDKWALNNEEISTSLASEIVEEEDTELDEFNALETSERLKMLLNHLRVEHNYCFWCKFTYPDHNMKGCPGLTERDHD